ncbi:conserved oligomeric Golgi complex subunit 3 [Copidosoma floridanum]|uniref:conserved oligomeric Golgi complex subunit 3 n=1 Tax=Copidosoma floridanum TaxID=29053 RepID=UPI0006C9508D|nr:conserved oligomeric Golgi complex subunit 3 [Copidosoma floridanum]
MAGFVNIPSNLVGWDKVDDHLAPLSGDQKLKFSFLEKEIISLDPVHYKELPMRNKHWDLPVLVPGQGNSSKGNIRIYQQLLICYSTLEKKHRNLEDTYYVSFLEHLQCRSEECSDLCLQIEIMLLNFSRLSQQYYQMSKKTNFLHEVSKQLIFDQEMLIAFVEKVSLYTKYCKEVEQIVVNLNDPTLVVNSQTFFKFLKKIEDNIDFMQHNSTFRESNSYLAQYTHCQTKACALIQNYIFALFSKATNNIFNPKDNESFLKSPDATMALFYGRFQSILPKAKPVIELVEAMSSKRLEFESLLVECHQQFLSHRGLVLSSSVLKSLLSIKTNCNGDYCNLVRHSCSFMLHMSIEEYRLFYQFFNKPSAALSAFSEGLCTALYDTLRPCIIHINHLETLAEICSILKIEMLDEQACNAEPLHGFGNVCMQLLHDVQERLVFRAHLYLQSDVVGYKPSPGDLAYPKKLEMMKNIAQSIWEENKQVKMKKASLTSTASNVGSTGVEAISRIHVMRIEPIYQYPHYQQQQQKHQQRDFLQMSNSPADLHGMWYPTVRRTLTCLSRLYRCVDRPVFQALSQEAIVCCVQSIEVAHDSIQARATPLDAELFLVKHLLILREQIAPFQVDFTVKEYSLDFSKVKTAAFTLLEKRSRLFRLSNNALLEFLLEGAPQIREHLIDSRKHVDAKLKTSCQRLIKHITKLLINPVLLILEKSKWTHDKLHLGSAEFLASIVGETLQLVKFKLPDVHQSMQLYLANRETECILFRPIKNNIVSAFTQFTQFLNQHYTEDELLLIACPLPEQVSVFLSSSSLAHLNPTEQTSDDTTEIFFINH